jgi:hypothetical protein
VTTSRLLAVMEARTRSLSRARTCVPLRTGGSARARTGESAPRAVTATGLPPRWRLGARTRAGGFVTRALPAAGRWGTRGVGAWAGAAGHVWVFAGVLVPPLRGRPRQGAPPPSPLPPGSRIPPGPRRDTCPIARPPARPRKAFYPRGPSPTKAAPHAVPRAAPVPPSHAVPRPCAPLP